MTTLICCLELKVCSNGLLIDYHSLPFYVAIPILFQFPMLLIFTPIFVDFLKLNSRSLICCVCMFFLHNYFLYLVYISVCCVSSTV